MFTHGRIDRRIIEARKPLPQTAEPPLVSNLAPMVIMPQPYLEPAIYIPAHVIVTAATVIPGGAPTETSGVRLYATSLW